MVGRQVLRLLGGAKRRRIVLARQIAMPHEANNKAQQQTDDREKNILSGQYLLLRGVFQQAANLLAQFGAVSVAVAANCMMRGGFEHFFFRTSIPSFCGNYCKLPYRRAPNSLALVILSETVFASFDFAGSSRSNLSQ